MWISIYIPLLLLLFYITPVLTVRAASVRLKKTNHNQFGDEDMDDERLDEEEEEDERALTGRKMRSYPYPRQLQSTRTERDYAHNDNFDKESVFQQGETRDFLQFLRIIRYDHRQCPENENGGAVNVFVSIVVSNVRAVSEVTMDYSLELFYRESWQDPRLRYNKEKFKNKPLPDFAKKTEISLHESYSNFLWHPDTFVPNAIASKNPRKQSMTHRSLLRLNVDGQILYSRRLSLVVSCSMDLTLFPFDSQLCKLGVESYGYTADQVRYHWSKGAIKALEMHKIRLPDFSIAEAYVTSHMESYATGDYSRLYVCFVFTRAAGFCFLQLIIPSTAVVITSWVSLWMENETSFQDMISIILTITFLLFSYNEVMPRVSYIKAMDVYLGVCFCIVFFSLIKLALVKYMRQRLRITRDTSIVAGMLPMLRLTNGLGGVPTQSLEKIEKIAKNVLHPTATPGHYTAIQMDKNGSCIDRQKKKPRIQFTPRLMHRFHWITQMTFFFGFVIFCLFYFLVYPNIHTQVLDPHCDRNTAEWFADIN